LRWRDLSQKWVCGVVCVLYQQTNGDRMCVCVCMWVGVGVGAWAERVPQKN